MSVPLSDYLALLKFYTDQTHKFWGYFQIVAPAVIGFAWLRDPTLRNVIIFASVFLGFALVNGWLVVDSQMSALAAVEAIRSHPGVTADAAFRRVLDAGAPLSLTEVVATHALLSAAAIAAILARYWLRETPPRQ